MREGNRRRGTRYERRNGEKEQEKALKLTRMWEDKRGEREREGEMKKGNKRTTGETPTHARTKVGSRFIRPPRPQTLKVSNGLLLLLFKKILFCYRSIDGSIDEKN